MKKTAILLLLCLALCLLAACGSEPAANAGNDAPEAAGDTIKVGILGCHTGDYAVYGLAVKNGAELYINQLNEAGGVNGKQIEMVVYDNKGDDAEAVNAFTRMVDEGITALVGDVLTGNTLAVVGEAYPINMPMITPSATAASVTYDPDSDTVYSNVFRTCFIDPFQGEKMAAYSAEILGAKTAAVIYQTGNDYSIGLKDAFMARCEQDNVEVVDVEAYAKGDVDFKAQMTNIATVQPDVIFCPNYYQDDGLIVTQAREVGVTGVFVGGDGWAGVSAYASAEDLENSVYASGYAADASDATRAFVADYTAAYGEETLNMFAATGYDAAMVLCNALRVVEEAGGLTAGSDEYKQAVIDAIRDDSAEVAGITSPNGYTFDEYNNPVKDVVVQKLVAGKEVFEQMY